MKYLQNLGRSLMLPVAVLPAAAILVGLGNWLDAIAEGNVVAAFLETGGIAILDHLAILFAVGVAIGLSKDQHGAAGLSGLVGFLIITTLLETESVALLQGIGEENVSLAFDADAIENVFLGIISGIVASIMYNRFSHVRLPDALAFFSGKRLVPIMTAGAMMVVSLVMLFVWPVAYAGLVAFGTWMMGLGPTGAGLYGFFNRLLIPTGLHHALNNIFWFDLAGIDDIANFWASEGEQGITGRYLGGFFPIMMFGLPAAALAMYHTAKTSRRKYAASLLLAAGFASFFTGVTEPLEFSFMFLAPLLFVVHAALTGLSMFIAAMFEWTAGFSFSAGLVDYTLSLAVPIANQPYMLLVQGLGFAVIYYFLFRFLIQKFDLKTPGREDDDVVEEETAAEESDSEAEAPAKDKTAVMAERIYAGLGGDDNVSSIDNCVSRLRVEVDDMDKVDQAKIKATGVPGVNVVGKHSIQVVVGTQVQFVADEIIKQRHRK